MAKSKVRRTSRWIVAIPAALGGAGIGVMWGLLAVAVAGMAGGAVPGWVAVATAAASGTAAWLYRALLVEGSVDFVRRLYMGSDGGTTPEYSVARGLEARGRYEAALAEYAAGAAEYPEDPEPLLLGARLLREHLHRPQEALTWLKRARRLPDLTQRDEIRIDCDLVELYEGVLEDPAGALPILARIAERHAGTQPAQWAARRLAELRAEVWLTSHQDPPGAAAD